MGVEQFAGKLNAVHSHQKNNLKINWSKGSQLLKYFCDHYVAFEALIKMACRDLQRKLEKSLLGRC